LKRLQDILGDPLLVRSRDPALELAPRAQSLRAPLVQALELFRGLFLAEPFDPAHQHPPPTLMMPDHVADRLLPLLL